MCNDDHMTQVSWVVMYTVQFKTNLKLLIEILILFYRYANIVGLFIFFSKNKYVYSD